MVKRHSPSGSTAAAQLAALRLRSERRCAGCDTPFPGLGRQRWCSNRCKVRAYQARRKRAAPTVPADPLFPSLTLDAREPPSGWVQWKGTEVCADLHCACGASFHYDGWSMYHIQCPACGQVWECSGTIRLFPVEGMPESTIVLPPEYEDE